MEKNLSTEAKIKEAARKLFQQKGFSGTKSRDIAEEAGINLALLNYYFRSKEKLFEEIMTESVQLLFGGIIQIATNTETSLVQKIDLLVNYYLDTLQVNPNLPLFVLGELQANAQQFADKARIPHDLVHKSVLFKQVEEQLKRTGENIDPLHIIINVIAMSIMPIIAKPLLSTLHNQSESEYWSFINERRKLIPQWIKTMLKMEE